MTAVDKIVHVRVLEHRSLSLTRGEGLEARTTLYIAGQELDLPAGDADLLAADGYVEKT